MELLRETARAKINLTLKVLGRRKDGFHELNSLVVFAGIGDVVRLRPDGKLSLAVSGAFCEKLDDDNLVLEAARLLVERCGEVRTGAFSLEKNLPVAAGLGGGSADAAAALRLIGRANPGVIQPRIMEEVACRLGSDVPACLASRAGVMRGRGEQLFPVEHILSIDAVLVNPGIPLLARDVYSALEAPQLKDNFTPGITDKLSFASIGDVLKQIAKTGNDLQQPAIRLAPVIEDVLAALSHMEDCQLAQMSGSGSTCFGVFANAGHASRARDRLRAAHPDWWAVSTRLA